MRSIVPSDEKPRSSARLAQSSTSRPGTSRTGLGRPMPMRTLCSSSGSRSSFPGIMAAGGRPRREVDMTSVLRTSLPTNEERSAAGRALREKVRRGALGRWKPTPDRPDPLDLIEEAHEGRLQRLVPVRVGRMVASPYAFLRGSAALMAEDFAHLPRTGVEPVICGDAHLGNFGFYASPERDLVFDLNDFDEAHPGPWEWDLYRLTTSVWVAGRQNGLSEDTCEEAFLRCASAYRRQLRQLAGEPLLTRSFDRLDIDRMRAELADWSLRGEIERAAKQARRSCVARFVHGDTAWHAHQGQRVVEYQQTLQTVSDPLLGWTTVGERDYYVRQFRDMKGAITVDGMDGSALMDYSRVCGTLLAKGHARSTGATVLSGYLGKGDSADRAFARFARAYADQTEADHEALRQAVSAGRLPAEAGI